MSEESAGKQPAIARIWRGRTRRERADEYEAYNDEVGIKPLIEKAMGGQTFRGDRAEETEFMTVVLGKPRGDVELLRAATRRGSTTSHATPSS